MGRKKSPENVLCYINQAYLSTVKGGELAIYNYNFILGQLIIAANQPDKIDEYVSKKSVVKIIVSLVTIHRAGLTASTHNLKRRYVGIIT